VLVGSVCSYRYGFVCGAFLFVVLCVGLCSGVCFDMGILGGGRYLCFGVLFVWVWPLGCPSAKY